MSWPILFSGGMGVAVSSWRLVRSSCLAAEKLGIDFLGIVSLTAIGDVAVRRLQLGDTDMLRALAAFPVFEVADMIRSKFFVEGGKKSHESFFQLPLFSLHPSRELIWINIFAGFAEVWLAKDGHNGRVGVNILEKIQMPIIYNLLGAMWAGAWAVVAGAGLPLQIPRVISAILQGGEISYRLSVSGEKRGQEFWMRLDPESLFSSISSDSCQRVRNLKIQRPFVFPIVTLSTTGKIMEDKVGDDVDGYVVEEGNAGGHNAPPRDKKAGRNKFGEPIYGPKDVIDFSYFSSLGKPFWPAGGYLSREKRKKLSKLGATGFQIGGPFGLCDPTGLAPDVLHVLRRLILQCRLEVLSNPLISSSGYPFQTASIIGTMAEARVRGGRKKRCNLGYLRQAYCDADGELRFRCSAEDPSVYVSKGGKLEDTVGKACLCNGLTRTAELGQIYPDGYCEAPVVTFSKTGHEILRRLLIENDGSLPVEALLLELVR